MMRTTLILTILVGCAADSTSASDPVASPAVTVPPGALGVCDALAPSGHVIWSRMMGAPAARTDVVVDGLDGVLYANAGLAKLTGGGDLVYAKPFGQVVAGDRAGNAYTANALGASTTVITKLDAAGHELFAATLPLCGDCLRAIAVDRGARVAISGDELGTVVLDRSGAIEFSFASPGAIAFDSAGNLVFADGASLAKIDLAGKPIWSLPIAGSSVAVGEDDAIAVAGTGFVDKIATGGRVMWTAEATFDVAAVAIDPAGDVLASGSSLVKLSAGNVVLSVTGGDGHGVAADSCGNIYWATSQLQGGMTTAVLAKIAR